VLVGTGILGIGKSFIGALPAIGSWTASMWAVTAAHFAAFWPVYAIIGGVAALTAGVYLLVKNWDKVTGFFVSLWNNVKNAFSAAWDWIKNLIFGTSDWILVAVSIFMPIVGIPALIIKHWDVIKDFFGNLWSNVTSKTKAVWETMPGFFSNITSGVKSVWNTIPDFFSGLWENITGVFSSAWNWIKSLLFGTSDWILGVISIFMPIVGISQTAILR
jgi:phage-related minor tail protein